MMKIGWTAALLVLASVGGYGVRTLQGPPQVDPAEEMDAAFEMWFTAAVALEATRSHAPSTPCGYAVFRKKEMEKRMAALAKNPRAKKKLEEELAEYLKALPEERKAMISRRNRLMVQGRKLFPHEEDEIAALGDGARHYDALVKELEVLRKALK